MPGGRSATVPTKKGKAVKGAVLVTVLLLSLIMLVLTIALFTDPAFIRRAQTTDVAKYLAETGAEFARGYIQQWSQGLVVVDQRTSGNVPPEVVGVGPERLFWTNGNFVEYPMPNNIFPNYQRKNEVFGIPLRRPIFDNSSPPSQTGTETVGYFAYFLMGGSGDTYDIYALGAIGEAADRITSTLTIHTRIKPFTYSEYTTFVGNPNNPVFIRQNYVDPFYGRSPISDGSSSNYSAGEISGLGRFSNFNKAYLGGELTFDLPANANFKGFDWATYYVPKQNVSDPSKVKTINSIKISSVDQLFTDANISETTGLPEANCPPPCSGLSQLQNIMDDRSALLADNKGLRGVAEKSGVFISGNKFTLREGSSYSDPQTSSYRNAYVADIADGVPGTDDSSNRAYNIELLADGRVQISSMSAPSGGNYGDYPSSACTNTACYSFKLNGNNTSPASYTWQWMPSGWKRIGSTTLNLDSLNSPVIYVQGNANLSGTLNGKLTVVAEGKVTIKDSIKYHDQAISVTGNGTTVTPERSSDLLGVVTPRKIEIYPASGYDKDNLVVSGTLLAIGSNPTTNAGYDANWTIQLEPGFYGDGNTYNSITFFGSQIQYARNANWLLKYKNGRHLLGGSIDTSQNPANPFRIYDLNLLSTQPPSTPVISAGYNTIYWAIVNNSSGQDIVYQH